jgi:hypothetical protein
MRRLLYFVATILLTSSHSFCQDLLVKHDSDSIECRILEESETSLKYIPRSSGGIVHEYPKSLIKYHEKGFYQKKPPANYLYKNRFSFGAGLFQRTANFPDNISSLEKKLITKIKTGLFLKGNYHYFVSESFGIGLEINGMKSSGEVTSTTYGTSLKTQSLEDKVSTFFIAPSFTHRFGTHKGRGHFMYAPGVIHYKDDLLINGDHFEITGSAFTLNTSLGVDLFVGDFFDFGMYLDLSLGSIKTIEMSQNSGPTQTIELSGNERESLSKIGVTLMLVFH